MTRVRPGDHVMINPGVSCYHCAYCLRGDHSLCETYGLLGEHLPGTAAEYIVVPARNCGPMPAAGQKAAQNSQGSAAAR